MPFNLSGALVPFQLLLNPRLIIPAVAVPDIRHLDFAALRRAGYRGAVFDKDNCLTIPHKDTLVPELKEAWKECLETFGPTRVLIVSNSAGTVQDPAGLAAESVEYHLGVPVLRHVKPKPSRVCAQAIRAHFAALGVDSKQLIVVGDKLGTDVVLAHRLDALSIWTTRLWVREGLGVRMLESGLLGLCRRWTGVHTTDTTYTK